MWNWIKRVIRDYFLAHYDYDVSCQSKGKAGKP